MTQPNSTPERASFLLTALLVTAGAAQAIETEKDRFGGCENCAHEGTATGFFHVEKQGDQWLLMTPEGNPMWVRAVYDVNPNGLSFPGKYGDRFEWAEQTTTRLDRWGFNVLGEYQNGYALPVPTFGRTKANPKKMPFLHLILPSASLGLRNRYGWAPDAFHDIIGSTDPAIYRGYRGGTLPDVFDPNFRLVVRGAIGELGPVEGAANWDGRAYTPAFRDTRPEFALPTSPWLVGIAPDDPDQLFGLRWEGAAHPGYTVAIVNPQVASRSYGSHTVTYVDPTIHSKIRWREYLEQKYPTIEALNASWGSTYTTFGSDGGWGVGTGVMDENGASPWMEMTGGPGWGRAVDPNIDVDFTAFLEIFVEEYFSVTTEEIRAHLPNHLIFGPPAFSHGRPEVNRIAARYVDVLQVGFRENYYAADDIEAELDEVWQNFKGPLLIWLAFTAQLDSPVADTPSVWGSFNFATQQDRGAAYANMVERLRAYRAPNGDRTIIGLDFWSWTDKTSGGEFANFGLVTQSDNAYDGLEAIMAAGLDPDGYPTGGETGDYGNFLGPVIAANHAVEQSLLGNRSPVLAPIGARSVDEGAVLTIQLVGTDGDDDPVTYSALPLPEGATLDTATGEFEWTPSATAAGSVTIRFEVSDGELAAGEDVTITVDEAILVIAGRLRSSAGEPAADVAVELRSGPINLPHSSTRTGADGTYQFTDVSDQKYRIVPLPGIPRTADPFSRTVEPAGSDRLDLDFTVRGLL